MRRFTLLGSLLIVVACKQTSPDAAREAAPKLQADTGGASVRPVPTVAVEPVESPRTAAAKQVMSGARSLCNIREEEPHLVVECTSSIAPEQQLKFAQAIANADVVLTGRTRNIYYYLPDGRQFAQADPLNGIRLK